MTQKIHPKADTDKVKQLISELREEKSKEITKLRKDMGLQIRKKEDDSDKLRTEIDLLLSKTSQEYNSLMDKL